MTRIGFARDVRKTMYCIRDFLSCYFLHYRKKYATIHDIFIEFKPAIWRSAFFKGYRRSDKKTPQMLLKILLTE